MKHRPHLCSVFFAAALAVCTHSSKADALVVPMSVPELTQASARVVIGDVAAMSTFWNADSSLIMSTVAIVVTTELKGAGDLQIALTSPGGTIGEMRLTSSTDPVFAEGDHVLLFLNESGTLTGAYQGAYLTDQIRAAQMEPTSSSRFDPSTIMPFERLRNTIEEALPLEGDDVSVPEYAGSFSLDEGAGFLPSGCDWAWQPSPIVSSFWINPSCSDVSAGTAEQQVDAIIAGANRWNNAGTSFAFDANGQTATAVVALDGEQVAFFANDPATPDNIIATCFSWCLNGNMQHWDIKFNDVDFVFWNGVTGPCTGMMDIEAIAAHELGHALGLGHSTVPGATMAPSTSTCNLAQRSLEEDDIEAVHSLYGANNSWIDFAYGGQEDGSFSRPFNTLAEGLNSVNAGGFLWIKAGSTSVTPVISQAVTLRGFGGTVTIGN
jgi:Matrixin